MSWGLGNWGEGQWGLGGSDQVDITATSSTTAVGTRVPIGRANISATGTTTAVPVLTFTGNFIAIYQSTTTTLGQPTLVYNFARADISSTADGSGFGVLAWDGIDDVTTTWTEINID
tara:strand:- start:618 stop:968 length:351 start_codon:yes stop_codon:yes gene_type:complete